MRYFEFFKKSTFNPKINNFDVEFVKIGFDITLTECKDYRKSFIKTLLLAILVNLGLAFFMIGFPWLLKMPDADAAALSAVYAFGFGPIGIAFSIWCLKTIDPVWRKDEHGKTYRDYKYESMQEYQDLLKHNEEQVAECERWRSCHPLEEKIRLAQKSGNCVDVASLIQHILNTETV